MFDDNSKAIAKVLVKFNEHERMIWDSVKWAYEKMNVTSETGEKIYKQYIDAVDYLERIYLLCIKANIIRKNAN